MRTIKDIQALADQAKVNNAILNNPKADTCVWQTAKNWLSRNADLLASDALVLCEALSIATNSQFAGAREHYLGVARAKISGKPRIKLFNIMQSDSPMTGMQRTHGLIFMPGEYDAEINPYGAVTVVDGDTRLGLRPGEFEWVE